MSDPIRPITSADWRYGEQPYTGYYRTDGSGGNPLYAASSNDQAIEQILAHTHRQTMAAFPGVQIGRYHLTMPLWSAPQLPTEADYQFVATPQRLTTTSITVVLVPDEAITAAEASFHFEGTNLPNLRQRMAGQTFDGIVGNLGYYITPELITTKPWAHNKRFPDFPLPVMQSYIGFHWDYHQDSNTIHGSFTGGHPAALAIRHNGQVDILPQVNVDRYTVHLGEITVDVSAINDATATDQTVVLFTPAYQTTNCQMLIKQFEDTAGTAEDWQTHTPLIPLPDSQERVHVFIANQGNGQLPVEQVAAVWAGAAPLPSFGGVLSFKRETFDRLFGNVSAFKQRFVGQPVQIIPQTEALRPYRRVLGGFVPAVGDGQFLWEAADLPNFLHKMGQTGNATAPIPQASRESRNFDPFVREPAGLLVRTEKHTGWIMFDGRHEHSIGVNMVDVHTLLKKLGQHGAFGSASLQQAFIIDGGSAMKAYHVTSEAPHTNLGLLNRVAGGGRNAPGIDPDGLNLYSTLALDLKHD